MASKVSDWYGFQNIPSVLFSTRKRSGVLKIFELSRSVKSDLVYLLPRSWLIIEVVSSSSEFNIKGGLRSNCSEELQNGKVVGDCQSVDRDRRSCGGARVELVSCWACAPSRLGGKTNHNLFHNIVLPHMDVRGDNVRASAIWSVHNVPAVLYSISKIRWAHGSHYVTCPCSRHERLLPNLEDSSLFCSVDSMHARQTDAFKVQTHIMFLTHSCENLKSDQQPVCQKFAICREQRKKMFVLYSVPVQCGFGCHP